MYKKIIFNKNNKFKITSKKNNHNINRLESNLLLIYTGKKRIAQDVAKKYRKDPEARDRLAQKILSGGMGAWGEVPMPPHPQHNIEETQQMIDAILSINAGGEKAE